MIYTFHSSRLKAGAERFLRRELDGTDFYAEISLSDEGARAQVFERESGERYALFDVKSAGGEFLADIRNRVQGIIDEIRAECFEEEDLRARYISFLKDEFGVSADFPWAKEERYSDAAVFRCPSGKWFALIMHISLKNLGFESDEGVFVVNLKADSEKIAEITDKKSVFPAYHMNKKHWITVLLSSPTDFDTLCALTRQSFERVSKKKKLPALTERTAKEVL